MSQAKKLFSAVQPTGELHLGNYLGALKNFVTLQKEYECIFSIADLHALTQWEALAKKGFDKLTNDIYATTATFLACGIDAKQHIIFNQSKVSTHAELAWVLTCVARFGWLNRMTQFKEKAGGKRDESSAGLFTYPTLMAADILAYRAHAVPIGEDQKQHLELARDIAQKFNTDTKQDFFPLPEPIIPKTSARVMSLRDGTKKMSKSEPSEMSRISLTDDEDSIAKKIKKAKTDAAPVPDNLQALEARAEADNLVGLLAALSQQTKEATLKQFADQPFAQLKQALTQQLIETLCPMGEKIHQFYEDKPFLDKVLNDGAQRARAIAESNFAKVRALLGLL